MGIDVQSGGLKRYAKRMPLKAIPNVVRSMAASTNDGEKILKNNRIKRFDGAKKTPPGRLIRIRFLILDDLLVQRVFAIVELGRDAEQTAHQPIDIEVVDQAELAGLNPMSRHN